MHTESRCPYCVTGVLEGGGTCCRCGKKVTDENRPLPAGTTLYGGRFRVERPLGSGGFGITYSAWEPAANRRVAVKELFPANSARRGPNTSELQILPEKAEYFRYSMQRFLQEAKILHGFRGCPEILQVFGFFQQYGTAYFVMEYLQGEDIGSWLAREKTLPWKHLEKPVWDTLQTLRTLHSHGLIHRDISPDNIILLQNGNAKLIDFGSVRDYENADHFTTIIKRALAPPELFQRDGEQGPWTDVYLLCATLYYLLSGGHLPKHAYDRVASARIDKMDTLIPLARYRPDAPEHVIRAVERGLALNIGQRFSSMDAMSDAFFPQNSRGSTVHRQNPGVRTGGGLELRGVRGLFRGSVFPLAPGQTITIGRAPENTISYPGNTGGISWRHCAITADNMGKVYIQDERSSYGTYMGSFRLEPHTWYRVSDQQTISLGLEAFQLICL